MFDELWRRLDLSRDNIATVAKTIPKDVDQAYAAILNKSPDKSKARKLLRIVLAAMTPLSVEEVNVAMVVGESTNSYKDLEWSQTFRPKRIEEGIVVYDTDRIRQEKRAFIRRYVLSYYAATNWSNHLVLAGDLAPPTLLQVMAHDICNPLCYSWGTWAQIYITRKRINPLPRQASKLTIASLLGLDKVVAVLLEQETHQLDCVHTGESNPLSWAAREGHRNVAELLLAHDYANAGLPDLDGMTPLHWTALYGHRDTIKLSFARDDENAALPDNHGRTPADVADNNGNTPLLTAVGNGRWKCVSLLLKKGVQVNSTNSKNITPLLAAVDEGNISVVKLLLAQKDLRADITNQDGHTPLACAVIHGHEEIVKLLIDRNDVQVDSKDHKGRAPLSYAVGQGRLSIAKKLLQRKADIGLVDNKDMAPLSSAAGKRYQSLVNMLIQRDADIESKDKEGRTPLSYAVEEGHESLVNILIQRNADIESKDDIGRTPLYYAADAGEDGTIKILLESVAHVDSQDIHDRTALQWTVIETPLNGRTKKRVLVIVTLLGNGAEINHKDSVGRTPLSNACYFAGRNAVYLEGALDEDRKRIDGWPGFNRVNPEDSIKLLLEKGADVVTEDNWKRTPLFYATYNGSTKVVKLLLQSGARLDSRTIEGNTPLGIANKTMGDIREFATSKIHLQIDFDFLTATS
ncbi:MAG: hypothetical protein Q9194_005742 [Teloschistes cf. exilis]